MTSNAAKLVREAKSNDGLKVALKRAARTNTGSAEQLEAGAALIEMDRLAQE